MRYEGRGDAHNGLIYHHELLLLQRCLETSS